MPSGGASPPLSWFVSAPSPATGSTCARLGTVCPNCGGICRFWICRRRTYFWQEKTTLELAEAWVSDAGILDELEDDALDQVVQLAQRWSDWASSRATAASRASFMVWVREQWRRKPGLVHRHVKPGPPPELEGAGPD
eukprot:956600-Pyramimonas_sp.AAC.1